LGRRDPRLSLSFLAVTRFSLSLFLSGFHLQQDTALHLASKFGHVEMVSEIVKLCPDMVATQNKMLETPIHEACRRGTAEVLKVLLDRADPTAKAAASPA
jgi:ankyrin repeat protein